MAKQKSSYFLLNDESESCCKRVQMTGCGGNISLVSVVVTIYKVEHYLCRCIDSIVGQTYQNLEIILVDDGSPDNCPIICDEYAKKNARIKVIHKTNGGVSDARNVGMGVATGEYLTFVDGDDWIGPTHIEHLFNEINDCNWIISGVTYIKDNGRHTSIPTSNIEYLVKNSLLGYACNKLYRLEAIADIHFCQTIREDIIFNLEVFSRYPMFAWTENAEYYYLQREKSILHTNKPVDDMGVFQFIDELNRVIKMIPENFQPHGLYNYIFLSAISDQFASISQAKMPLQEKARRIKRYVRYFECPQNVKMRFANNTLYKLVVISFKLKNEWLFLLGYDFYLKLRRMYDKRNCSDL